MFRPFAEGGVQECGGSGPGAEIPGRPLRLIRFAAAICRACSCVLLGVEFRIQVMNVNMSCGKFKHFLNCFLDPR